MRLFVAVVPDAATSARLAALERPAAAGLRWTTPEQWHVTLRFIGTTDADDVDPLAVALDRAVPIGLVQAEFGPATAWFSGRHVLQVPVSGLDSLAAAVRSATAHWGAPHGEAFQGHLTLARSNRRPGPSSLAGAPLAGSWPVTEVVLFTSVGGGAGGPRYEALHRTPLS